MITAAKLLQLITIAAQLSGYPQPAPSVAFPDIKEVSDAEMCSAYGDDDGDCGIVGLFVKSTTPPTIMLNTEWLRSKENMVPNYEQKTGYQWTEDSFLVHELVHWLQFLNNKYQEPTCEDHTQREAEAYEMQNRYELLYEKAHKPVGSRGNHLEPAPCQIVVVIKMQEPPRGRPDRDSPVERQQRHPR